MSVPYQLKPFENKRCDKVDINLFNFFTDVHKDIKGKEPSVKTKVKDVIKFLDEHAVEH